MDKGTLGVEQVELVVETGPSGGDGSSVGQHAERSRDLGEISTRNERGGLVADTELETGRTPVDELDGPLGLDVDDGGVDVPGHTVSSVKQTGGHVFTLTRVTLDHLRRGLETGVGHLGDRVGLVEGWMNGTGRSVGFQQGAIVRDEAKTHPSRLR